MYAQYKKSFEKNVKSTSSKNNYGDNESSFSKDKKKKYGSKDAPLTFETLYYGNKRKKPQPWDRMRAMFKAWKTFRKDGKDEKDKRERTPSPPRPETPPPPPKPVLPKEELPKQLHVEDINMHIKENTENHRTDEFDCTKEKKVDGKTEPAELVVRRGGFIKMTLTFDRPYDKEKHDMELRFSLGEWAKPSGGTMATFKIDESGKQNFAPGDWGATLQKKSGNDVVILVHIPSDCIIGEWNFHVKTICEGKDKDGKEKTCIWQYEYDDGVTILFNPWCPDDTVYMPETSLLDEYVLCQGGAVYRGNSRQPGAKEWNFGQFQAGILDVALMLVTQGFNPCYLKPMSDPVIVSRMVSKMVNSADDYGVLTGNWSGNYSDGVSPTKWAGSVKILKQWYKSGPVKYGQCWVFSCLATTICRALGIPCRSVTNFSSAHDTDKSCSIDKYFRQGDGEYIPAAERNNDSVWNFHVWNDVWFSRPDLAPEFPGPDWQAIDSTPQELSNEVFACGPCPLNAVRTGNLNFGYDTDFVFSEVNADQVHWLLHENGDTERMKLFKHSVGKCISTKKPTGEPFKYKSRGNLTRREYSDEMREDITNLYKSKEGSAAEREAVMNAHRTAQCPKGNTYTMEERDEPVQISIEFGDVMIGEKLPIKLTVKNIRNQERQMPIMVIGVYPQNYTGYSDTRTIHRRQFNDIVLNANEEKIFETIVDPEDYFKHLVDQAPFIIITTAYIAPGGGESEQRLEVDEIGRFRRPDIDVECPDEVSVGEDTTFVVSFTNPLDQPLTGCNISLESIGFKDFDDLPAIDVPAKGIYTQQFTLPALKAKKKAAVYFSFDSKEIQDISGSTTLQINP